MTVEETRSMTSDNTQVSMDEVLGVLGKDEYKDFEEVMAFCDTILDDPTKFVGMASLIQAAKLAAIRTRVGMRAQYYKTVNEKTVSNRRRKDLLMTMYTALEENINTLKILGRTDARMENWK